MLICSGPKAPGFQKLVLHTLGNLVVASTLLPRCYILEDIPVLERVDEGGFSDIYWGHCCGQSLRLVAMRLPHRSKNGEVCLFIPCISDPVLTYHQFLFKEAVLWGQLHHPNILPFYGISYLDSASGGHPCLVSPWMTNGNLVTYLKANPDVTRESLVSITGLLCCDMLDLSHLF